MAVSLVALVLASGALIATLATGRQTAPRPTGAAKGPGPSVSTTKTTYSLAEPTSFAVGLRALQLVDTSRTIHLPNGRVEPRSLEVDVRYPTLGPADRADHVGAPAARPYGPFPLVVFGHGFAVTPAPYTRLLRSWARAGYVVAAPVFPLGNANAPGGPNESDLVNQPADMSFVISRMLAADRQPSSPFAGLIQAGNIAVSGQSDGGDTALTAAYNRYHRDRRITAAVILSGAEIPGLGGYTFPPGSPPLLATQGTADTINLPSETATFFESARRPKYLLRMFGAEHLPPYQDQQPELGIVERVTIAFFDTYLKRRPAALKQLLSVGNVPGITVLLAKP